MTDQKPIPSWVRKARGEDVKVPYPAEPPTCWCGGKVGTRDPGDGDEWDLGCLDDPYHDWTDLTTGSGVVVQLVKTGQNMGDHAADVISFAQVNPDETLHDAARRLLKAPYGDPFGRTAGQYEWYLRIQLSTPVPRRALRESLDNLDLDLDFGFDNG